MLKDFSLRSQVEIFHFPVSKSIVCRTFYFLVKGHSPFIVVSYHLNLMILWPLTLFCFSRCIGWPPTPRLLESSRSSWGPPSRWVALSIIEGSFWSTWFFSGNWQCHTNCSARGGGSGWCGSHLTGNYDERVYYRGKMWRRKLTPLNWNQVSNWDSFWCQWSHDYCPKVF